MPAHVIYTVSREGDRWRVARPGGQRASGVFEQRKAAIAYARRLAAPLASAVVIVHKESGAVAKEYRYGKAAPQKRKASRIRNSKPAPG